jgi:hypothetical protein
MVNSPLAEVPATGVYRTPILRTKDLIGLLLVIFSDRAGPLPVAALPCVSSRHQGCLRSRYAANRPRTAGCYPSRCLFLRRRNHRAIIHVGAVVGGPDVNAEAVTATASASMAPSR